MGCARLHQQELREGVAGLRDAWYHARMEHATGAYAAGLHDELELVAGGKVVTRWLFPV